MLKKGYLIGSLLTALCGVSYASAPCPTGTCAPTMNAYNGVYLGIGMGYQNLSSKITAPNYSIQGSNSQNHGGIVGSFLAGYDHTLGRSWLLGFQASVSEFQANTSNQWGLNSSGTQQGAVMQDHPFYTYALRGGYLINPNNLLYVLVGGESAQFQAKYSVNGDTVSSKNSFLTGYMLGIGADQHICGGFHVFEQLAYANFGNDLKLDTQNIKFSPQTYSALLGMAYRF